ncbi:hypothetical protein KQI52_14610 [bacterium]|nr:hypothetical protein [bacterium]
MLLLHKDSNDKGRQLEELTLLILKNIGFADISEREITIGGSELDLTANLIINHPAGRSIRRLICECKAHSDRSNMPDFLKFLGKIYTEEAVGSGEVYGYFISLNGVNGNVQGLYNSLSKTNDNIKLYTGDQLNNILLNIFGGIRTDIIGEHLFNIANRRVYEFHIVYYDKNIYAYFDIDDNIYTILNTNGSDIEDSLATKLQSLEPIASNGKLYQPIKHKYDEVKRAKELRCDLVILLLLNEESIDYNNLLQELPYDEEDINNIINILDSETIVNKNDNIITLIKYDSGRYSEPFINVFLDIISMRLTKELLDSYAYRDIINNTLLDYIINMQPALHLSADEKIEAQKVLRLSPSAIIYSCIPDQMLKNENNSDETKEWMNKYYFSKIYQLLISDYRNKTLYKFYLDRGIREIEVINEYKIKSVNKIEVERNSRTRYGVGELSDELGGGIISILIIDHCCPVHDLHVEPWSS